MTQTVLYKQCTLSNMKMYIEVEDHKVELITKLLEHIPFVKINDSQIREDQFQQKPVGVVRPESNKQYLSCS